MPHRADAADSFATMQGPGLLVTGYCLPYDPKLVQRARALRRNMTPAERKLWYQFLRRFELRVLRQRPIDRFIVDFYCAARKLVIEIDGDSHSSEEAEAYDKERTAVLEGYGLRVLRFHNPDVLHNFEGVCEKIIAATQEDPPSPP